MKTYFEAWNDRMNQIDSWFRERGAELLDAGYTVLVPKQGRITFMVVLDHEEQTQISLEFREVPYRWEFSSYRQPCRMNRSSVSRGNDTDIDRIPSLDRIVDALHPAWKPTQEIQEDKLSYLTLLSFLSHWIESLEYGDDDDLFDTRLKYWAIANKDEISLLQFDIEESDDELITTQGTVAS